METLNRSELMKNSLLEKFYNIPKNREIVYSIVSRNTSYSRRVLEWFCSNYCKKYNVSYKVNDVIFNVFQSYKCQLNGYKKKQFDPFKRFHKGHEEFKFNVTSKKYFMTTVGQLNFFKWCIENKILSYIEQNIDAIKNDMKKNQKITDKQIKTKKITTPHMSRVIFKKCNNILLKFS
jgi:hypothetical protein